MTGYENWIQMEKNIWIPTISSMFYSTIGIIRVQVGVYHEIFYEASVFNRLNFLGFASEFNLLNTSAS